jgi:Mor family transcriptional regulator
MADKVKKGRSPDFSGGKGPRCKLTMEQARKARLFRKNGMTIPQLMEKFNLSRASMKTLLRGDSYKESRV